MKKKVLWNRSLVTGKIKIFSNIDWIINLLADQIEFFTKQNQFNVNNALKFHPLIRSADQAWLEKEFLTLVLTEKFDRIRVLPTQVF